jgi:uncharacterized protein YfaS (alpha-2-macroglobulin family)
MAVFCFLLPALAHADAYFSVSTDRTFHPGEKATVHLYAREVQALEFRLYRVNDPVLFFEKLGDVHGFGHSSPKEEIDQETWVERFHDWKRETWLDIRNFFRRQFSPHSRAAIRESQDTARKHQSEATLFAQVPLLNSKQLVARWRQEMPPRFFSDHQNVPVEKLDRGVYVIEATDGTLRAYTLLLVTQMAVITKTAPGQMLAFAVDRDSGAPTPNTSIELWANKKTQGSAKTDAQGLAQLSLASGHFDDIRVLGVHDKDVALVAPEFFNISSNPAEDWTGYVYTDRPIYRPGHTVHFKGILRKRSGERYMVPAGEQVSVKVEDTTSKQIYQTNVFISAFGSVHGDFALPPDAALGYYSITVKSIKSSGDTPEYGMSGGFRVEEYKKPEYDVRVIPDKPRVLQGEAITATIQAKYFFGEPVAGAEVKYAIHRSIAWSYVFGDEDDDTPDMSEGGDLRGGEGDDEGDYAGDQIAEKSGKLDANGQLKITIPTTVGKQKKDFRYHIEAKITDESRREISGHESVLATYGSFQVGIRADKYMYHPGDTIDLTAVAKDYSGKPVQTAFRAEMVHFEYGQNRKETILDSRDGQIGPNGQGAVRLIAREGGATIRIKAQTPEGREVEGETWLWIASPNTPSWGGGEEKQIQIIPDRKSYKAGDTANLLIMTSASPAHLLVTTEGRTLQTQQVIHTTGTSTTVSVPITKEDEPNVHVAVAFISKDTLYSGNKNLKVPADEKKLKITIEPTQPQFKPGEAARYNIVAVDTGGKPAVGEFSVGVVDEAIYSIQPDSSGDIQQFFYGQKEDRVSTQSSLSFYFVGEAGNKPFYLASGGISGGGLRYSGDRLAQLKPSEPLVQPKVRKVFPDTALWLADIKTDSSGHAQAQLAFPDSLTTWRATIRGATLDTKVGSAMNRVIVRKNLMVRLAVPRFFRQGDDVTVSTIVHNYLSSDKNAQVSLQTRGLDLQDGGPRQAVVATKGDQRQDWHVHAQNVHESDLLAKALTNEESDALELTLPVIPFGVKLTDSKSGAVSAASGQEQATVNLPGDPNTASPTLNVSISPSIAGSIFGALDYLTAYPYGCTEQTMSSFLPNIVVARAMKDLNLESTINTPELAKKISAGLDRLYDFQHEDGGWGWWKEDESMVFMTAYVVSGLSQAKAAGYGIKEDVLAKSQGFLRAQLSRHSKMKADLRAYVVYALALDKADKAEAKTADAEMLNTAYQARGDMSAQGLAMLGLALFTAGDKRATDIAAQLEKQAVSEGDVAYWKSDYDSFLEFYGDDSAETTAYAIRLLSLTHPDSPLLPKAAVWLVSHRDSGFYWQSTKQTAMVVFGLLEYVKISHELDADFTADVFVNDKKVLTKHFTREDSMNSNLPKIYLTAEQLQSGANTVRVQKSGAGRLYWSAHGEYYSTEKKLFQNNKLSLSIMRDYYRLAPQQKEEKIVYNLEPLSGDVHSGDVIAVRLSVNGSPWRYLLVEDPIPAGAEFVERDNLYELNTKTDWWSFFFTRREFHDDHAAFFQTYFNGHMDYVYLLKIVNPGKFRISPASAQPMYQPSILSTTDAATMEVK